MFIPDAGACLTTRTVLNGSGRIKWMVREEPADPADNGWRIFSEIDTQDDLDDPNHWQIVDFNEICDIEPAIIGIWDRPTGADLQLVIDDEGRHIVETHTGREIPIEDLYIPPQYRA